jgi:hypothetical protein
MEIKNMSDAINNFSDQAGGSNDVFNIKNYPSHSSHAENSLKLEWVLGKNYQASLDEAHKLGSQAEQELIFAAEGLYYPMIAAIITHNHSGYFSFQYVYARLPEGEHEDVAKAVESEMIALYPSHQYCGFLTIQPSQKARMPVILH